MPEEIKAQENEDSKNLPDTEAASELSGMRGTRPSTETNIVIQLLVGLVGTAIVSFGVVPLKGTSFNYLWAIIRDRGPVQYFEVFMAFMIATLIFMKSRIVRAQLSVIAEGPVDPKVNLEDDDQVQELRTQIVGHEAFSWSIVLNRIDRILALWLGSKDVSRVSSWAEAESDRDTSASDSSYAIARVLIWAIPILGFIGTVMGLGQAVAGFANFLAGAAELSQIKEAIARVTIGLGMAFDTTLLALVLSVLLMFPLSAVQRKEEGLFVEIDNYLDDYLISRLPSPERQPIVIENLEDSIEAAFRRYIPDPDRYEEVFTRSIERAAGVVEERFAALSKSYESALHDLTGRLSSSIAGVGDELEAALQKTVAEVREQDEKMLALRRKAAAEDAEKLKAVISEVNAAAEKVAAGYREKADELRKAVDESARRTVEAADKVATRLEDVAKMAKGIEQLLHVQEAVEKSFSTLVSSEEFRKTLDDLRGHLATTDAFCKQLSKPRVITLREEIVE